MTLMNKKVKQTVSEKDLQKCILEYLTMQNIFHYRNNSGAARVGNRFIRYGTVGSPDIICVIKGLFVGIEVKGQSKNGQWGKQSDGQIEFQKNLEKAGGKYILAKSLTDVINGIGKVVNDG